MTGPKLTLQLRTLGIASFLLSAALSGCGFGGNSSNNSSSGGSSGTGSSGPGSGTNSSATYVYAASAVDAGGAYAWKLDSDGNLTAVAGSPFLLTSGTNLNATLMAANGFVYIANRPNDNSGADLYTFKADTSSGALSQSGSASRIAGTAEMDIRHLVRSTSGTVAYASTQFDVLAIALNSGRPTALNSQPASNGEVFGLAVGSQFVFAGGQDGNPKSGFQTPVVKRFAINADGSLGAGQVVATLSDANIPRDLALDPSGKFLAVTTGSNNGSVTVFPVATDGSLTQVGTGSTGGKDAHALAFDSSSKFLTC